MNTAVIDIGTNTLLLLIVDEQLRRVVDLCRFGRLGKGLDASGNARRRGDREEPRDLPRVPRA